MTNPPVLGVTRCSVIYVVRWFLRSFPESARRYSLKIFVNGLNTIFDSHFLQEGAHRNLSEIKILANPRSLLDVIE